MFRRLHDRPPGLTIHLDGRPLAAVAGETVAEALLAAGIVSFRRTEGRGDERGPWCLVGACHECRMEIDGRAGVRACRTTVADGMRIRGPGRDGGR